MESSQEPKPQSLSEKILWAQANFFLQLFVWGTATASLILVGPAVFLAELFGALAVVTGLIGIAWAVVPLWLVLYPRAVTKKRKSQWTGPGLSPLQSWLVVLLPIALVAIVLIIASM